MSKIPLTIHVDPEAARVYEAASIADRELLDRMMDLQLKAYASRTNVPIDADSNVAGDEETTIDQSAPRRFDRAERLRRLRAARGIWEGRTDLPTRDEFRQEWDERMSRLGLGD